MQLTQVCCILLLRGLKQMGDNPKSPSTTQVAVATSIHGLIFLFSGLSLFFSSKPYCDSRAQLPVSPNHNDTSPLDLYSIDDDTALRQPKPACSPELSNYVISLFKNAAFISQSVLGIGWVALASQSMGRLPVMSEHSYSGLLFTAIGLHATEKLINPQTVPSNTPEQRNDYGYALIVSILDLLSIAVGSIGSYVAAQQAAGSDNQANFSKAGMLSISSCALLAIATTVNLIHTIKKQQPTHRADPSDYEPFDTNSDVESQASTLSRHSSR